MQVVKDKVQQEALTRWEMAGCKGLLAMGTGTGKTRVAMLRMERLYELYGSDLRVLIAVPTETLRDNEWPAEAKQWGLEHVYETCAEGVCYASLAKAPSGHYHLVVLDEAHHITPANSKFLENITYDELMALTATEPKEDEKTDILDKIAPTVFSYSIDQGVEDGISADFNIYVIEVPLDEKNKTFKIVPKKKKGQPKKPAFYVTERKKYEYMSASLLRVMIAGNQTLLKFLMLARARFIYNSTTKTALAKTVMARILEDGARTIIFAGSIKQADELAGANVYHSKSSDDALKLFQDEKITYLAAVNALNEGKNIRNLDQALIVQLNSNERDLTQRLGRVLRFRPNHVANIFILVATGTVDEEWAKKALASFDQTKIIYLSYKNFI